MFFIACVISIFSPKFFFEICPLQLISIILKFVKELEKQININNLYVTISFLIFWITFPVNYPIHHLYPNTHINTFYAKCTENRISGFYKFSQKN